MCLSLGIKLSTFLVAGLGLVGLAVAHLGASLNVVTDGDDDCLQRVASNAQKNGFTEQPFATGRDVHSEAAEVAVVDAAGIRFFQCEPLQTQETKHKPAMLVSRLMWNESFDMERVRGLLFDHEPAVNVSCDGLPSGFDVILAADVIYEECAIVPLVATVCSLLGRPGDAKACDARFVLSFARRKVPVHKVIAEAASKG
jgi:predicted nicotinamide N-methyase